MKKIIVIITIIVFVIALAFAFVFFELRQLNWGLAAEFETTQSGTEINYEANEELTPETEVQIN